MQFVSNNIFPIFIALFSGSMLFWSIFGNRIRGIKEVDCPATLQLVNHKNALVLDVREDAEYKLGHILNSMLIPLGKLNGRIGELEKYKERPIVVVCRSGSRSGTACAALGKKGDARAIKALEKVAQFDAHFSGSSGESSNPWAYDHTGGGSDYWAEESNVTYPVREAARGAIEAIKQKA